MIYSLLFIFTISRSNMKRIVFYVGQAIICNRKFKVTDAGFESCNEVVLVCQHFVFISEL